jgi:general secretion pathway protein C
VGGGRIAHIGFNSARVRPAVWIEEGGSLCQLVMGEQSAASPASSGTLAQDRTPASGSARAEPAASASADLDRRIQRVGANEFQVDRGLREQILERDAPLSGVRAIPEREGSSVVGLHLVTVRRGSLLSRIGLESGDRLRSVNGLAIATPAKALEAYTRLRTADDLRLAFVRDGRPEELVVRFR